MPLICQSFVENAWKKELCANCFKSLEDHSHLELQQKLDKVEQISVEKISLSGQDSLTELEKGTNRYLTVTSSPFGGPNSHYSKKISKWNDTAFHHRTDQSSDNNCAGPCVTPTDSKHSAQDLSHHLSVATSRAASTTSVSSSAAASSVSNVLSVASTAASAAPSVSVDDKYCLVTEVNTMKDTSTASSGSHDVIERLDSLVLGTPLSSLEAELCSQASGASSMSSSGKSGILKDSSRDRSSPDKKRGITFPDYEELQEIIGYGGDMYYSSDEEDAKEPDGKSDTSDYSEELTQEERNVMNITKKNTSFNSHPQNLKDPSSSPAPKLGVDKKHTPIISVRPFVREHTPGKVNKVSPMINGEVVGSNRNTKSDNLSTKPLDNKLFGSVKRFEKEEGSGRGEIKMINKKDSLGSDGSTENSSSDSDSSSNTRDSPSPTDVSFGDFEAKKNKDKVHGELYKKQQSFLSSQIEEQKAKSSAASARLSFLSNYSSSSSSAQTKSDVSSHKVKPSNYMDEPPITILTSNNAKLSLLNKNSSLSASKENVLDMKDDDKVGGLNRKPGAATTATTSASARLSFLNSTINGSSKTVPKQQIPPSPSGDRTDISDTPAASHSVPVTSSQISEDNTGAGQTDDVNENTVDVGAATKNVEKVISSRNDAIKDSPKVKLTRKSPYVVGPFASNSCILKGTPKPMITRKPPILKDKPKVPLKPNKLMMRSPSSSPSPSPLPSVDTIDGVDKTNNTSDADDVKKPSVKTPAENNDPKPSPVAAPRKASFCQKTEYVNISPAGGYETKLEETSSINATSPGEKDSETIAKGHDQNNSLIISVTSTKSPGPATDPPISPTSDPGAGSHQSNKSENSPPQVQKNLANKNKEALEAIRKSLSNKLISSAPPALVMESIKASEGGKGKIFAPKPSVEKTSSNSFEETRASIADALQFNRHAEAAVNKPNAKRQAPRPPDADSDELDETFDNCHNESKDDPSSEVTTEEVSNDPEVSSEPKLTPAIRNSSMKSEHSGKNKDSKPRTVQFSPETVTVTVPSSSNAVPKVISYNSWVGKYHNHYLESSFTGQPITMYPPGVIGQQIKQKPGLGVYAPPVVDEGPRKWTEKKGKWRSKSTPRSSEIDEIIGSSKTKAQNRLAIFTPSSPQPIKRQSRVEIYESEKRGSVQQQQQQKKGKFSLKKLFKIQGLPDTFDDNNGGDNKFIDKEHEREILERKVKVRPEIIHPLDLLNSGVEVVKITPKNSLKGHYDKHKSSRSAEKSAVKRQADLKAGSKTLDPDGKDSGHDTASIHTETSEGTEGTGSSSGGDFSHTSVDFSPSLTPVGVVPQPPAVPNVAILSSSCKDISLGVNSVGKPKPLPPPRSQSLETFATKKFKDEDDSEDDQEEDNEGDDVDEKDNTIDTSFHPKSQSTPQQSCTSLLKVVSTSLSQSEQTVYANLGQTRTGLTPHKPHRTGGDTEEDTRETPTPSIGHQSKLSMGDVTGQTSPASLAMFHAKTSSISGSINSEAMSDSTISFPSTSASARKIMDGSEADSERDSVSPQRLHDTETVYADETESPVPGSQTTGSNRKRVSRLSMRKGRSVVHKNLEDNYGAVITANHEALAQILEQVCQNRPTPSSLKSLASALNLRFTDFSVLSESEGLRTGKRAFFPATWGSAHLPVTLMVSRDMTLNNNNVKNSFSLTPIAQFVDQVPNYLLSGDSGASGGGHVNSQAVVWALSRSNVLQFGSYAKNLKQRRKSLRVDEFEKDMSFVLLQLINGLKYLQAQGIEETISDLDNFLLARSDSDNYHRLIITEECHKSVSSSVTSVRKMSLCQCALAAMLQLFDISDPVGKACEPLQKIELPQIIPSVSMFKTMAVILQKDGGVSLGQVKSMLEYMLWGPSDIIFDFKMGREAESREEALQRWLDLERATVLNNIIRTQGLWNIHLTVYEEYHLLFLVRTCAKMLCEASLLFESEVSRM